MHKYFLFDLDGTLLPMDLKKFIEIYLQAFCRKFAHTVQIEPKTLVQGIRDGASAMGANDGDYRNEFVAAKAATKENPYVKQTVDLLKSDGCKLIVATNPIFPKAATYTRLRWAGLDPNDFDHITVYDNCSASKPNLNYYYDICSSCGITPEESIVVGNDVDEDMCAAKLGFDTFLVTDCLINRRGKSIERYKRGSFEDFYNWLIDSGY